MGPRRTLLAAIALSLSLALALACGGGGSDSGGGASGGGNGGGTGGDPWASVTAAIQAAQSNFPGGLAVEVMTPAGVVYSKSFGSFSTTTYAAVASSSKMVSGTVLLQLVDKGVLGLDTKTSDLLRDRQGQPWSGPMGQIRLRHLLSFTSGISGEVPSSDPSDITLDEAVMRIYED